MKLTWNDNAICAVEKSIDNLIIDFIEAPYLHRVEQSVHCELYRLMANHRILSSFYKLADGQLTQSIHKEWPTEHKAKNGVNRGNCDFCIIPPDALGRHSAGDFNVGKIQPIIAIELGLNANSWHFNSDCEKLTESPSVQGYIVHLLREQIPGNNQEQLEELVLQKSDRVKVAYAFVSGNIIRYKLVNDDKITERNKLPEPPVVEPPPPPPPNGLEGEILRCVSARGGCSLRRFNVQTGMPLHHAPEGAQGRHQDRFADVIKNAYRLREPRPVNIVQAFREGLPSDVLREFQRQIKQGNLQKGPLPFANKEWFSLPPKNS